ncbi:MAG TPA: MBOAT family O-acyltransferase [Clostridia bacterium]|nr:MBOAT family O-acyltransferase [Clostridia bacterium]
MVFSSYEFIFVFLPVILLGYFLLSKTKTTFWQHLFLVVGSLFFYAYFNVYYLFIILASIVINYFLSIQIKAVSVKNNTGKSRFFLILGIVFNIGMLGYYKYYDFFIGNINAVFQTSFHLKHLLLPLGIRFFTFQQFSFLIAIYNGESKSENFIEYALFVSFFPQLVAGPIVLYDEMMPQFKDASRRNIDYGNLAQGVYIFTIGLFKKIVIADTVALFANNGFNDPAQGYLAAWAAVLAYTLQIYFDFSGYSDMAIGLGKMFNINIPINFRSPYKSKSVTEFWKRWHITLGRALGTYVYIPLGGNRKGRARTYLNLFATFIVSGLWHGAAWTFVLWGAFHGFFVVMERILGSLLEKIPNWIRMAATFVIVSALWVLFRAESFAKAMEMYSSMIKFSTPGFSALAGLAVDGLIGFPAMLNIAYVSGILLILTLIVFTSRNTIEKAGVFQTNTKNLILTAALFTISVIHLSKESIFIYFNF